MSDNKINLTKPFAIALSILLIAFLVAFGIYVPLKQMGTPKKIVRVAVNVDLERLTNENPDLVNIFKNYGFNEKQIGALLDSETAEEVLTLYSEDISTVLKTGELKEPQFTGENVEKIVINDFEQLLDALNFSKLKKKAILMQREKNEAQIKAQINDAVKNVPKPDIIYKTAEDNGYLKILEIITSPAYLISFIIAILILVAGICALRYHSFEGVLWVGICCLFSALILSTVTLLSHIGVTELLVAEMLPKGAIAQSAIEVLNRELLLQCINLFSITAVLFLGYFALNRLYLKEKSNGFGALEPEYGQNDKK